MGVMLNLNKNWIDLASMLQYSNDQIIIFFGNDLLQIHKLRLLSWIKLFEEGTCLNCLSLVNMIQYMKWYKWWSPVCYWISFSRERERERDIIPRLSEALQLPHKIVCCQETVANNIEALHILLLKKLSYTCRLSHMVPLLGRNPTEICDI